MLQTMYTKPGYPRGLFRKKEMFYLITHNTFSYGYMASDIW